MKKFYSSNEELKEILVDNGIDLICNEDMEIIISDQDAARIEEIVSEQAPAAAGDYSILPYKAKIVTLNVVDEDSFRAEVIDHMPAVCEAELRFSDYEYQIWVNEKWVELATDFLRKNRVRFVVE